MDTIVGAMASESTRTGLLKLIASTVGFAVIWPYVLHLFSSLRRGLDRATAEDRERRSALRAIQERQQNMKPPPRGAPQGQDRARDVAAGADSGGSSPGDVCQKQIVLPPPRQRPADFGATGASDAAVPRVPETSPLTTLEEVLAYGGPDWGQGFAPARPLPFVAAPFPPLKSRLLVCHDLAGGYGEDRLVQGGGYDRPYRMYDWGLIDIFVYFSHNLVTIPPAGWIDVAHRHGTRVLGTFLTEWAKGYDVCTEFLKSEEAADRVAEKLTQIAVDYGFDGWLINIENKVDPGRSVDVLVHFVRSLTLQMHAAASSASASPVATGKAVAATAGAGATEGGSEGGGRNGTVPQTTSSRGVKSGDGSGNGSGSGGGGGSGSSCRSSSSGGDRSGSGSRTGGSSRGGGSTVLWYDSVTVEGELAWQDRLNDKNRVFFDACDGIFSNYAWKADYPSASALEASARRFDVYMGIDTFGRGTWGGGGFDVDKALGKIRRAGVSAALFAPSWTLEDKTTGGGRIDPDDPGRGGWREVEHEFGEIDAEFWGKIGAAWQKPRDVPGWGVARAPRGQGAPPLLPMLVNFGHGVGNAWRIQGEAVAAFRVASGEAAATGTGQSGHGKDAGLDGNDERPVVGGAYFDLASQCLTPLIGGRGDTFAAAGRGKGTRFDIVHARRARDTSFSHGQGGANGMIGARYSFETSFDGGTSLRFTGVLHEKATAIFPLYSCDVPLPAEPLEVRVTFCGNPDSELALVLSLDVPGQLGGRREVVLRDWGREGIPEKEAVFSTRLTFTETKATYSPAREEQGPALSSSPASSAENGLQARVRALREAGESYGTIWRRLRAERGDSSGGGASSSKSTGEEGPASSLSAGASTAVSSASCWVTRTYVVRDLRMGGSLSIRGISVVCARRQGPRPSTTATAAVAATGEAERSAGTSSSSSSLPALRGGRRLADSGSGRGVGGGGKAGGLRGVAGLAAYRAFLGEVAVGPWRRETPSTFGKIRGLRAEDLECFSVSDEGDGDGDDDGDGGNGGVGAGSEESASAAADGASAAAVVDLSLAWESEGCAGRREGTTGAGFGGVFGAGSPWATAHCDVWMATGAGGGEEIAGGWRWLGRASGQKYRLTGLRVGGGRKGGEAGEGKSRAPLVLAVQQVNAMGYRQPVDDWARLVLCLPP